jgi:hypothetical protein
MGINSAALMLLAATAMQEYENAPKKVDNLGVDNHDLQFLAYITYLVNNKDKDNNDNNNDLQESNNTSLLQQQNKPSPGKSNNSAVAALVEEEELSDNIKLRALPFPSADIDESPTLTTTTAKTTTLENNNNTQKKETSTNTNTNNNSTNNNNSKRKKKRKIPRELQLLAPHNTYGTNEEMISDFNKIGEDNLNEQVISLVPSSSKKRRCSIRRRTCNSTNAKATISSIRSTTPTSSRRASSRRSATIKSN